MPRRTKIVSTLGPATDDPKVVDRLIDAGVDVVRINLSHGTHEEHASRAAHVRNRARACGRQVGVLVDLQGPKIRTGKFIDGAVELAEGDEFIIDVDHAVDAGTRERVGCTYKELPQDLERGHKLLVNDGKIVLWVEGVAGSEIHCKVKVGGQLSDNKGINKYGGGLSAPALTDKDKADIRFAAEIDADYLAISFVRSADDIRMARELLTEAGGNAAIVAKVERAEALEVIDEIIDATDVIMVARGDLGVEIGDAELPAVQKKLISETRSRNKVVITATQMMESMIDNAIPTRAEVFDVANAVLDGTDAVMLSAETAVGKHPAAVVEAMARICVEAEKQAVATRSDHRLHSVFGRIDEAIAMATMYTANHLQVSAIAALTESGSTPLWMSRISSGIPIYALTDHVATRRKVTLYRGVYPTSFQPVAKDSQRVNQEVIEELLRRGAVHDGDLIIITKGDFQGIIGGTNVMKIIRVGEHILPD
jgi:pyruvate kinase